MERFRRSGEHHKHNIGLHYSIRKETPSGTPKRKGVKKIRDQELSCNDQGNTFTSTYRCSRTVKDENGVPVSYVLNTKIQRKSKTDIRPEASKLLPKPKEVSTHKSESSSELSSTTGLPGKIGSISGLLPHTNQNKSQKVSKFRICGGVVSNDKPSFWPFLRSTNLLPSYQLDCEHIKGEGPSNFSLLRRLSLRPPGPQNTGVSGSKRRQAASGTRVGDKSRKVCPSTDKTNGIFGDSMGHRIQQEDIARGKSSSSYDRPSETDSEALVVLGYRHCSDRQARLCSSSHSAGTVVHKKFTASESDLTREGTQEDVSYVRTSSNRLRLVDPAPSTPGEAIYSRAGCFHNNGRLRHWVGRRNGLSSAGWALVKGATGLAHKPEGTVCSFNGCDQVQVPSHRKICDAAVRQQNCGRLSEKSGRHEISHHAGVYSEAPGPSEYSRNESCSLLHTRPIQYHSGLPLKRQGTTRLALEWRNGQEDFQEMGSPRSGPVCHQPIQSRGEICDDRCKGYRGRFHQCFQPVMDIRSSLDLSSSSPNTQGTSAPVQSQEHIPISGSPLGKGILEELTETQIAGGSISDTRPPPASHRPVHQSPPTEPRKALFGGLEGTGWSNIITGLPAEDIDLLQSAWRDSTWRTYRSAWNQWSTWCKQNGRTASQPRPHDLSAYLGYLARVRNLSYATILVHKSVIATLADPSQEHRLSSHPLITTLLKGINLRSCSKSVGRSSIWNVQNLIQWLQLHVPESNVTSTENIFKVSRHVSLLLLLASGRRIHDLTLLKIDERHCQISDRSIIFWPAFGSKSDSPRHRQSGWELTSSEDDCFDLVRWVKCLIQCSSVRRKARNELSNLFITTRGEVKAASRTVISGWIRTAFQSAGIDCSPGSIRSAVASNSFEKEVPLDKILARGNWRSSNVFFKHYCKLVERRCTANDDILDNSFNIV